jgi:hypothetical protein
MWTVLLLRGDGVIADDGTVFVPVLDDVDDASFSGVYALGTDHAFSAVKEFLRHGSVEGLGDWQEL